MENKHAVFSPSSSKQWIMCPRSIKLSKKFPKKKSSEYAEEGTAAHDLASKALEENKDAVSYIGQTFNNYVVTEEMVAAVQVYLDQVRIRITDKDTIVRIEQKVDLSWLHPGIWGTSDCYIFDQKKKTLPVIDYKHGVGIPVDAEWNSQAMIYALGALHKLWVEVVNKSKKAVSAISLVDTVEVVIVQPRWRVEEERVQSWVISTVDLLYWGLHILKGAAVACEDDNAPLRVGDHCRFCPCLAGCPAQAERAMELAKTTFAEKRFPDPEDLTPEHIAKVMEVSGMLKTWVDSVKDYAQRQMEVGQKIPGFKLVQKKSNRKWINEKEALTFLRGQIGAEAFEVKVLSVAKAEKVVKSVDKSILDKMMHYWEKPDTGLTMAPVDDRRKEMNAPAGQKFLDEADFMQ